MQKGDVFHAANFNEIDEYDDMILKKLIEQYWQPEDFAISNDLQKWREMTPQMRDLVMRVFTGLTMLDTLQGEIGAPALLADSRDDGESAVWSFILMTELVIHARSYSTVFQTLSSTKETLNVFAWSEANDYLQNKASIMRKYYGEGNVHKKKVATVMLESFLFYSGFFLPLWLHGQAILTNTGDMVKTIIKDEAVHGAYAGAKYQQGLEDLSDEERDELQEWTEELLEELYLNEIKYTENLYADFEELVPEVKLFLKYNADRALQNLGYEPIFNAGRPSEVVMNGLSLDAETHDFFSTKGAYIFGKAKKSTDETWNWFKTS